MKELNEQPEEPDKNLQRENEMAERSLDYEQNCNKKGKIITKKTMDKKTFIQRMGEPVNIKVLHDDFNADFGLEGEFDDDPLEISELYLQYVIARRMEKVIKILVQIGLNSYEMDEKIDKIFEEIKEIKSKLEK